MFHEGTCELYPYCIVGWSLDLRSKKHMLGPSWTYSTLAFYLSTARRQEQTILRPRMVCLTALICEVVPQRWYPLRPFLFCCVRRANWISARGSICLLWSRVPCPTARLMGARVTHVWHPSKQHITLPWQPSFLCYCQIITHFTLERNCRPMVLLQCFH